ncbi:MAG TPA: sulfatase-like hydrolase/transferase [Solirubrobacterales bacterium]|nr:sulfatase-like hydrolase/transferase [Solirubrobacterales bacterium]
MRALAGVRLLLAASVLALISALAFAIGQESAGAAQPDRQQTLLPAGQKPNIVVIQTDDQTIDQLYATYTPPGGGPIPAMPNTLASIAGKGMTFNRYYVSYPLCCPSRVSLLTGRYAHNHNVRGNVPPNGGATGFGFRQANSHNVATWLQGAGYRTIHIGKFLNGYGDEPFDDGKTVPPGWNAWHSVLKADTHHYFYGYTLNNNGSIEGPIGDPGSWDTREYGIRDDFGCPFAPLNGEPCFYETDVLTRIASEEMQGTPAEQPFYLQLDYTAPHGDFRRPAGPEPATRHYDSFAGAQLPHDSSEGVNEGNVNDKPLFLREAGYLSPAELHTYRVYYQKGLESLRSIDDGVQQVINTLGAMQRLRNTYIIFTSDNGFFYGEHRLTGGKFLAYEPATHMPLLIRGPGIKQGSATGELASNVDIAPTILELAGAEADKSIDGRSLVPFLVDPELRTRRPILFESFVETNDVNAQGGVPLAEGGAGRAGRAGTSSARGRASDEASASIVAPPKDYIGIRLGPYKYIEWPNGEKELYDINKDPFELNNKVRDRNLFPIRNFLQVELRRLAECSGRNCQETTEKLPLTRKQQLEIKRQKEKEQREREKRQKEREEQQKAAQGPKGDAK